MVNSDSKTTALRAKYDPELCKAVHKSLNWRVALLFTIVLGSIGSLFLLLFQLRAEVSSLPKETPPSWFLQRVDRMESNQEKLQECVLANQRAIAILQNTIQLNQQQIKLNTDLLIRIDKFLQDQK